MRIGIFYFSGTGNTEIAARMFRDHFTPAHEVTLIPIETVLRQSTPVTPGDFDLIGLGSVVHAWNAPEIVWKFIRQLPSVKAQPLFYFKCAAGTDDHGGATAPIRQALQRKGFKVIYETVLQMPSNFAWPTSDDRARELYRTAATQVETVVQDLLAGRVVLQENPFGLILKTQLGSALERWGAHHFGSHLKAGDACTGCGLCSAQCPQGNIVADGRKRPKFGSHCLMCLRCIYRCPVQAIEPKFMKKIVIPGAYNPPKLYEGKP